MSKRQPILYPETFLGVSRFKDGAGTVELLNEFTKQQRPYARNILAQKWIYSTADQQYYLRANEEGHFFTVKHSLDELGYTYSFDDGSAQPGSKKSLHVSVQTMQKIQNKMPELDVTGGPLAGTSMLRTA